MHIATAHRRIRIAQLWLVLLALVVAGVIFLPTDWLEPSSTSGDTSKSNTAAPVIAPPPEQPLTPLSASLILDEKTRQAKYIPPTPPKVDPTETDGPTTPPPTTVAGGTESLKYLGAIIGAGLAPGGGDLKRAIVKRNERQGIFSEGDMLDADPGTGENGKIKLVTIEPTKIVVEFNGKQETILLVGRTEPPPAIPAPPTTAPANVNASNAAKAMSGEDDVSRAMRDKLERRAKGRGVEGLDPEVRRGDK